MHIRSLSGLLAALAVSAVATAQRTQVPEPPPKTPPVVGEGWTPHTLLRGVEGRGPEVDSKVPDELRYDPRGGTAPGDESGTRPLMSFLKGDPYRLSYVGGDYVPAPGERLDPALAQLWRNQSEGHTWGFVMFQGRITTTKRRAVESTGVRLGNHHTFNCMTARIPFAAIPSLLGSSAVRWVGQAKPWQKIEPSLVRAIAGGDVARVVRLIVKVYESDLTPQARKVPIGPSQPELTGGRAAFLTAYRTIPGGPLQRELERLGARVVDYHDELRHFVLTAKLGVIKDLADRDFVHWVELDEEILPAHDRSTRQIHVDYVRSLAGNDGSNTVVGMMDSGMGLSHTDVKGKWYAGWTYNGQNPWNDPSGHGTHVMGTICGRGVVDDRYRGCAPAVGSASNRRIYIAQIFGGKNGTSANALSAWSRFAKPITLSNVTTPIPNVTNHSWGVGTLGMPSNGWVGTDALSIGLDYRVFHNRQTQVVAAHNQGGSSYASQRYRKVLRPAVAKLSLTVANGGSHLENDGTVPGRPHWSSNKGPTGDGRFCPQVMAPGRFIKSVKDKTSNEYVSFNGTSMATPHVTGTIAGMMEHYSWMKTRPAVVRAVAAATSNPYRDSRSWTTTNDSYYNRQGMGMIDAYKMHYQRNVPGGFLAGRWYGTFTKSTTGFAVDIDIPADATRTLFVLTFDERPPSEGAKRAAIHDLDLYLDAAPFSGGYNTGEFSSKRAWDTWDWYGNVGSIGQVRGKKLRLKIYPRVRPTGSDVVRFGLAYMIARGDTTPFGTVSLSAPSIIQPGQSINLLATVGVPSYMQTNTWLQLKDRPGFSISNLSFRDHGNLLRSYSSGPSDWTMGLLGNWFSSTHRRLDWRLKSNGSEGTKTLKVRIRADNRSVINDYSKTVCVDGKAPNPITGLTSTSHTPNQWSKVAAIKMAWNTVTDSGCAGISGLGATRSIGIPVTPGSANLPANAKSTTVIATSNKQKQYFNLRAFDKAGNKGTAKSAGPYFIDTVKPTTPAVKIANGAGTTTTLKVAVTLSASDAHSGIALMRRSGNGAIWSPWIPYQTGPFQIDLAQYGGGTNEGLKKVFYQVRDKAGNVSASGSDTITYVRCPQLRQAKPSVLENVTKKLFVLTGADLAETTRVHFGTAVLTSSSSKNWASGYFKVVDDNTIRVSPPQGLKPGTYPVRVESRLCRSNSVDVKLTCAQGIVLHGPDEVTAGKPFRLFATKGSRPAATLVCLAVSASTVPSVIPNVVSFGIGNSFAELILLPGHQLVDPTTCKAHWGFPSAQGMAGTKLHFETYLIDLTNAFPLPTSNVATIKFD